MNKKKCILLYDFLEVRGGAESLTLTLLDAVPNLCLAVSFVNEKAFCSLPDNYASRLIALCKKTSLLGWKTIKTSYFFRKKTRFLNQYDNVVYSGSNAPMAVHNHPYGLNILYCHTPPRYIYDLKSYYLQESKYWQKPLLKLLIDYFQPRYERAISKMDLVVVNSINVKKRVKKYLGRDAIVIYPPCNIHRFDWEGQGDYYLSTARIEPYKRIKQVVEAFMLMPEKKLVVASGGSQLNELKRLASNAHNIRFTGWCGEEELHSLVANCIATIYLPKDEDFGISPVESMAAGKPVIGVDEGGIRETVLDGETGLLCPASPSTEDIIAAVKELDGVKALNMRGCCEIRAASFSNEIFIEKMERLLNASSETLPSIAKCVDAAGRGQ